MAVNEELAAKLKQLEERQTHIHVNINMGDAFKELVRRRKPAPDPEPKVERVIVENESPRPYAS